MTRFQCELMLRVAALLLFGIVSACTPRSVDGGPTRPGDLPGAGMMTVTVRSGRGGNPAPCHGATTIGIAPRSLNGVAGDASPQMRPVSFEGLISPCAVTEVFSNLRPGTWGVAAEGMAGCLATVVPDRVAAVEIVEHSCQ
jgi:hypothetical protein